MYFNFCCFFYREDKKLKIDQVKKYLIDQKVIVGKDQSEGKLQITGFTSMEGEASIAVVRGKPRMGYELSFTIVLTGVEDTYLQDFVCELKIDELCDDCIDVEGFKFDVKSLLDTNQAQVAKECIGYNDDCSAILNAIQKSLKAYPENSL